MSLVEQYNEFYENFVKLKSKERTELGDYIGKIIVKKVWKNDNSCEN